MPVEIIILLCVLAYFLIGVIVAGLINRSIPDELLPEEATIFVIVWPLIGPLALFVLIYDWISGR